MRMEEKMQAQGDTIIVMRDIIKRFYIGTPNELQILNGISLDVKKGEFLSIVGASGSGKSTLMNIIGALDRPTEGTYLLDGLRGIVSRDSIQNFSAFLFVVSSDGVRKRLSVPYNV